MTEYINLLSAPSLTESPRHGKAVPVDRFHQSCWPYLPNTVKVYVKIV